MLKCEQSHRKALVLPFFFASGVTLIEPSLLRNEMNLCILLFFVTNFVVVPDYFTTFVLDKSNKHVKAIEYDYNMCLIIKFISGYWIFVLLEL